MSELVHYEVEREIGVITLDSPHNRNALSVQLVDELAAHLRTATTDGAVRGIVITATGTVFCSGADLKAGGGGATSVFPDVLSSVLDSPKPVIAKLNGRARAGGIGLIAACDIAVAPDTADFAFAEVRLGLVPAIIAVTCLRCMHPRAARRYMLTGEVFDADAAVRAGLLSEAVPADRVDVAAEAIIDAVRGAAPAALATTKGILAEVPTLGVEDGLVRMARLSAETFASEEAAEGMRSFAERRPPRWAR